VIERLPKPLHVSVRKTLRQAWELDDADKAERLLRNLARRLDDGTGERKFLQNSMFEYNACLSSDGKSVVFTSERHGSGQSDVFRARLDGTGIEPLVTGPAVDDAPALSPEGARLAFVSTRNGYRANIWVLDLKRRQLRNLTGAEEVQGDPSGPNCFFQRLARWVAPLPPFALL
jgi:WD40-like Beta Propeller Repeat